MSASVHAGTIHYQYDENNQLKDVTDQEKAVKYIFDENGNIVKKKLLLNRFNSVSAGYNHTLAIRQDGTVWAWGSNDSGKLGNGTFFFP
ncbi:hypothetical protein EJP82_27495 [Paenibacillus anaericanus]|uniref:Uncharacterized protein n=2 Tax=Paenibacillus anaericanus TaxID=170367 RepID=A0A433XTX9_9BACL|nr:hypothetical protein EJP82_27495 [Paenibacillus anaericanus]